jgi:RHS repeat-associated protein
MRLKWLLGPIVLLTTILAGQRCEDDKPFIGGYQGLLGGCIDPITGTFYDFEEDVRIPGSTLHVRRTHSSSEPGWFPIRSENWRDWQRPPLNFFSRWGSNLSTLLYNKTFYREVFVQDVYGSHLHFQNDTQLKGTLRSELFKGWNNLGSIKDGARSDSHNHKSYFDSQISKWVILNPQGIKRIFGSIPFSDGKKEWQTWMCGETQRRLPSGIKWDFQYMTNRGQLNCMWLSDVEETNRQGERNQSLKITPQGTRIESLSGQWVEYKTQNPQGYPSLLTEVTRSDGPSIIYEYFCPEMTFRVFQMSFSHEANDLEYWHAPPPRMSKKIYQEGKYRRMDYRPFNDVRVFPGYPFVYHKFDGYISAYFGPVGKEGREEAIYRLDYQPSKTQVSHGDGKFEVYEYDDETSFLKLYKECDVNKVCKRSHAYTYCQIDPDKGRVLSEALFDESQKPYLYNAFEYDASGNVIKKTSKGSLRNSAAQLLMKLSGELDPLSTADTYTVEFKYGGEPFHLKQEEIYPDGRRAVYLYEEGSDNLKAKLDYYHEFLLERHFYTYDKYAQIVLEIHDDGSSPDPDSLESVYHRKWIKRETFDIEPFKGLIRREKVYVYDVETAEDILLQECEYEYNSSRRVISKKSTECILGNSFELQYEYDVRGNIIREVDSRSAVVTRSFDLDGQPSCEQGPILGYEKFYKYDKDRRLSQTIEKYPDYPEVEWIILYEYDVMGRVIKITDPYGIELENTYDWAGRLVKQTRQGVLDEASIGLAAYSQEFRYDAANRKTYEKDEAGFEREWVYNMLSQPLYTKNQFGFIEYYSYDAQGRLIERALEGGSKEYYFYNDKGQLTSVDLEADGHRYTLSSYEYEGAYKSSEIDALGHQDFWKYDGLGNIIEHRRLDIESGKEAREHFVYDGLSRLITKRVWCSETDYVEYHTRYNPAGDVVRQWIENTAGDKYKVTDFEHDFLGRCLSVSQEWDEGIATTSISYDSRGNKIQITDPEGYQSHIKYTYLLGKRDNGIAVVTSEKRADGSVVEQHLSAMGQVLCYKLFNESQVLRKHHRLGYNALGKVVFRSEQTLDQQEVLPNTGEESWVLTKVLYGPAGHVIKRWDNYQGLLERLRLWEYDSRGFCTKKVEPSGLMHQYSYDQRGFMTACSSSDDTIHYTYEHDALGRLLTVTNQLTHKTTSRTYDAWGRIIKDVLEEGYIFQREWDLLGQPVKDIYPDGQEVIREYSGQWLRFTQTGDYVHKIGSYNKLGLAILEVQPQALGEIVSSYDSKGRLTYFSMPGYEAMDIGYNPRGDLTCRKLLDGTLQEYEYDVLSQLEHEEGLCERSYRHDSRQRRLAQNEETVHLDDLDQLITIIKENQVQESFDYDLDGHLTQASQNEDNTWHYTYDAWSRLTEISSPELTVTYAYDAFNRRTLAVYERLGSIEERKFGYLDQRLATVYSDLKTDQRYFVRGVASERGDTLLWRSNDTIYFPIQDMSGSCIGWRNEEGQTVSRWDFDCFGICLGTRVGPWSSWGKYQDEFTGMVYFGARDYIPSQGRWLTRDPKGEIDGSNLFAFVGNNPVTRFDEWGTNWVLGAAYLATYTECFVDICHFAAQLFYSSFSTEVRCVNDDLESENFEINGATPIIYNCSNPSSDNMIIYNVNGNDTTYQEYCQYIKDLGEKYNMNLAGVYNWSASQKFGHGTGRVLDATRAILQRNGRNFCTGSERAAAQHLSQLYAENSNKKMGILAHSHGFQVTMNIQKYCSSQEGIKNGLEKTHVRGLAGSGHVGNIDAFNSIRNHVNENDIIIRWFDGGAIQKQKESGILVEYAPPGETTLEKIWPDHFLNGSTCNEARAAIFYEWELSK